MLETVLVLGLLKMLTRLSRISISIIVRIDFK